MAGPAEQTHASRRVADLVGAGLLAAVGLFFLWRSLVETPLGTSQNPGPGAAPLLLAILLIAASVWAAIVALVGQVNEPTEEAGIERKGLWHPLVVVAAGAFAASAIGYLGYRLTVLLLLVGLIGFVERKPVLPTLFISAALAFGTYWLFVRVVRIPLPIGVLGF
jgi:putative tricarboxylic transport membrane protein